MSSIDEVNPLQATVEAPVVVGSVTVPLVATDRMIWAGVLTYQKSAVLSSREQQVRMVWDAIIAAAVRGDDPREICPACLQPVEANEEYEIGGYIAHQCCVVSHGPKVNDGATPEQALKLISRMGRMGVMGDGDYFQGKEDAYAACAEIADHALDAARVTADQPSTLGAGGSFEPHTDLLSERNRLRQALEEIAASDYGEYLATPEELRRIARQALEAKT